MSDSSGVLVRVCGLSKRFPPAVQALGEVELELRRGEVHALVGENGAGKSTLSRILAGLERADEGQIHLRDQLYHPASRRVAESLGVRMVMQELNLVSTLSVGENIFLNRLPRRFGLIDRRMLRGMTAGLLRKLGLQSLNPEAIVGTLGIGQQQLVEIARGLSAQCDLLILDEPTAALTGVETELLFAQIRRLTSVGVAVLYISHRLEEISRISEWVTVLRDGRVVGTHRTSDLSEPELIRMMVGRAVSGAALRSGKVRTETALRVDKLSTRSGVREVSFEVKRGEIFGLAGLMGAGRTETLRAIFGADSIKSGEVFLGSEGRPARFRSPRQAVGAGVALVTEDRKGQGLLLPLSVRRNISLTALEKVSGKFGFISRGAEEKAAAELAQRLKIRLSSLDHAVSQLSGGNQQKVVVAKWLFREPDILLFDEPTRGIDIGAKFEMYQLLVELAEQGKAIVVVSSELPELMLICNRIAVLSQGKLVRIFGEPPFDQDAIMTAALSEHRHAA